jgi:HAD superfamily hydrolase (TIGR01509 family)
LFAEQRPLFRILRAKMRRADRATCMSVRRSPPAGSRPAMLEMTAMTGQPEALIFDNDGVLVDTEALYFQANREALAAFSVTLDQASYVELFLRQGRGAWHLLAERGVGPSEIEAARAARDRRYGALLDAADPLIPGVPQAMAALARHYRLAIVTSSQREPFARVHARTGILGHFEFALTRPDYQHSKPDPEPYLRAVARLGLHPSRCLVIEDSERGLRAAKAAGLTCWVIPSGLTRGGRFAGADAIHESLAAAVARLLPPGRG